MLVSELDYAYPESLIATAPEKQFRTLLSLAGQGPQEISKAQIFDLFQAGDVLVLNDTRVLKRRLFTGDGLEILFINSEDSLHWDVLFMARDLKVGDQIELPHGFKIELLAKGLPQKVRASSPLHESYFEELGEFALPPYIQKARGVRKTQKEDSDWYQTEWATHPGSCAAPTASLHFTKEDLTEFKKRGVDVRYVTLHVGIGTFLPVKTENLNDHIMHSETAIVSGATVEALRNARKNGRKIWALGTTVTRTLESLDLKLSPNQNGDYAGGTDLFIRPGFEFKWVDGLLTNFHQPRSTLLSLVSAFAGIERTRRVYSFAVDTRFRLFSYGDLSIWTR